MSCIVLNSAHYKHNLDKISSIVGDKKRVILALKSNAYGHGILEIAKMASSYGVEIAIVKNLQEANKIKNFFKYVMVLFALPKSKLDDSIIVVINSIDALSGVPKKSHIALKLDTGMHRNGIRISDMATAFEIVSRRKFSIHSIFTHFASAGQPTSDFFCQIKKFELVKIKAIELSKKFKMSKPLFHSLNSSALFRKMICDDDLVRVGIASYGYIGLDSIFKQPNLKPVLSLWADRINTINLKKGQKTGYDSSYVAKEDKIISIYDVGYGDGLFRLNILNKLKTKDGKGILGHPTMDFILVEGSDDNICLFDDVKHFSAISNTITYEILVKLSPFIKRVII